MSRSDVITAAVVKGPTVNIVALRTVSLCGDSAAHCSLRYGEPRDTRDRWHTVIRIECWGIPAGLVTLYEPRNLNVQSPVSFTPRNIGCSDFAAGSFDLGSGGSSTVVSLVDWERSTCGVFSTSGHAASVLDGGPSIATALAGPRSSVAGLERSFCTAPLLVEELWTDSGCASVRLSGKMGASGISVPLALLYASDKRPLAFL